MAINKSLNKIQQESGQLRQEVKERTIGYIVTAFGLVAGLAWNDAIKALIDVFFPLPQSSLQVKLLYALLVTFIVVFISMYLARLIKGEERIKE